MAASSQWIILSVLLHIFPFSYETEEYNPQVRITVEGKVPSLQEYSEDWALYTKILVDGGQYIGFVK